MMAFVHIDDAGAATVAALTAEPEEQPRKDRLMSQPVNDGAGAARNVVGIRGAISSNVKLPDHAARSIG
jgi:hypothetical protein